MTKRLVKTPAPKRPELAAEIISSVKKQSSIPPINSSNIPKYTTKQDILQTALAAVGDRGLNYGKPENNFKRIADLWNVHLINRYAESSTAGELPTLDPHDVAMMMVLMKVARLENTPEHLDSWVDIAGYAACGGELKK